MKSAAINLDRASGVEARPGGTPASPPRNGAPSPGTPSAADSQALDQRRQGFDFIGSLNHPKKCEAKNEEKTILHTNKLKKTYVKKQRWEIGFRRPNQIPFV